MKVTILYLPKKLPSALAMMRTVFIIGQPRKAFASDRRLFVDSRVSLDFHSAIETCPCGLFKRIKLSSVFHVSRRVSERPLKLGCDVEPAFVHVSRLALVFDNEVGFRGDTFHLESGPLWHGGNDGRAVPRLSTQSCRLGFRGCCLKSGDEKSCDQ